MKLPDTHTYILGKTAKIHIHPLIRVHTHTHTHSLFYTLLHNHASRLQHPDITHPSSIHTHPTGSMFFRGGEEEINFRN